MDSEVQKNIAEEDGLRREGKVLPKYQVDKHKCTDGEIGWISIRVSPRFLIGWQAGQLGQRKRGHVALFFPYPYFYILLGNSQVQLFPLCNIYILST